MSVIDGRPSAMLIMAALLSAALAILIIGYFDAGAIFAAMRPIGLAGFIVVVMVQLTLYIPLGLAWWLAAPGEPARRMGLFVWGSAIAEAAAGLLPVSQIGGALIASRAVRLGGLSRPKAFGSNLVDITMEIAAQALYTLVGIAILASHLGLATRRNPLLPPLLAGVIAAAVAALVLVFGHRRILSSLEGLAHRLAPSAQRSTQSLSQAVSAIYRRRARIAACFLVHLVSWFAAAGGGWLILILIRRPPAFTSVCAIESLMLALRNIAFFAPAGLGVQEGAYALLGPLFGLPPDAAIALSLLKRGRDIAIGLPALASWQIMETRRSIQHRSDRRLARSRHSTADA